jgi:phage terminase small subunit
MPRKPAATATAKRPPGRPVDPKTIIDAAPTQDPRAFLESVMNGPENDARLRIDAAKALMPYHHKRLGETGKKEQAKEDSAKVAAGRFKAGTAPRGVKPKAPG